VLIEIKGVQFVNKGAELMLAAIVQKLKSDDQNHYDIVLAPNRFSSYKDRCRYTALQKVDLNFRFFDFNLLSYFIPSFIRRYLQKEFGVVFEVDIHCILDASGFSYGDQWGPRAALLCSNQIIRLARSKRPYIFMPQAFGPFSRKLDIWFLKRSLYKASLICARDEKSFKYIKPLIKEQKNLYLFPDFTNLCLSSKSYDSLEMARDKVLIIPNSKMLSAHNTNSQWKENYIQVLKNFISATKDLNLEIVLLNHEGKEDMEICQLIQSFYSDIEILAPSDPLEVKALIKVSKLVFSSRYHGCVSSLSQAIPCIGTSWSHKYEALFNDYEALEFLSSPDLTQEDFKKLINKGISPETRNRLELRSNLWKSKAEEMWRIIFLKLSFK
jgi:colanic acid/amylovoran biosynthesis protein